MGCAKDIFKKEVGYYMVSLGIGAILCFFCIAPLYRFVPSDLKRVYYIREHLENPEGHPPQIVVLGNSVVMNSVDCRRLTRELPNHPVAWNVSSPGQLMQESMIIFDSLPPSVQVVILGITVDSIIRPPPKLSLSRATAFKMYGYPLSSEEAERFRNIGLQDTAYNITRPYWKDVLESRPTIVNAVNTYVRTWIRKDLNLQNSLTDIFYPSPYADHVSQETLNLLTREFYKKRTLAMAQIDPVTKKLLECFRNLSREQNRRFVLLLLPDQPLHKNWDDPAFYPKFDKALQKFETESRISVFDGRNLLTKEYFVDHIHPDQQGAEIITDFIQRKLAAEEGI